MPSKMLKDFFLIKRVSSLFPPETPACASISRTAFRKGSLALMMSSGAPFHSWLYTFPHGVTWSYLFLDIALLIVEMYIRTIGI